MSQVQAAGIKGIPGVYRGYRSLLKKEIRRAKREPKIALVEKIRGNPKRFFKYIKGKRITRERIEPLKDQSEHICAELQKMDEVLDEYFPSVFTMKKDMKTWELAEISGNVL
eukprot:g42342.t1